MGIYKRNEFFGSILYNTQDKEYYFCDELTTFLLKNKKNLPTHDVLISRFEIDVDELEETIHDLEALLGGTDVVDVNNSAKEGMLSAPLRVFLDFTYACNLRCKHCFTHSGERKVEELNLTEKKYIIDQMVEMGAFRISIAGGEPLISDEFFPFVEYARSKGVDVSFTTNGTLLTEDIINKLNDLQIRTITISLDGANEKDNDLIRGEGNFKMVTEKISLLSGLYQGRFALRMTMMKHNTVNAEEYIQLAEKLKCKSVKFNAMRLTGRARDNSELLMSPSEYVEFVRNMELSGICDNDNVKVIMPLNPFQKDPYDYIDGLGFGCVAGKDCMTISPEGFVRPCSQLGFDHADGNCKTHTLMDIWTDGEVFNFYRTLAGNDECLNCEVYDKCRGGCRYRALQAGDVNAIDPYCYLKY